MTFETKYYTTSTVGNITKLLFEYIIICLAPVIMVNPDRGVKVKLWVKVEVKVSRGLV